MSHLHGCRARLPIVVGMAAIVTALAGCGQDTADLRQWIDEQQGQGAAPAAASAPAAPLRVAMAYRGDAAGDPFDPGRLEPAERGGASPAGQDPRASLPLPERLPLEAMVMVGTVDRVGERLALLRMDGALQAVRVGQRLGVHSGVVQDISERSLTVSEPVRDTLGRSTRRTSVLTLKEARP